MGKFFETDLKEVQDVKVDRLGRMVARIPPRVVFIPLDLARNTPAEAPVSHGFAEGKPTLFVMEGLTRYLPEHMVPRIFAAIGRSAPGSMEFFT